MPDPEAAREGKQFFETVPAKTPGFFLKGAGGLDWGMRNRLARIFPPRTGRTVMLAIDHGYFQGPTTGLERVDLNIVPLVPACDALMLTRGMLRTTIPAACARPVVLRASGGPSILKELSDEELALDIEDAIRLNAAALAIQVFIGGVHETRSVHNLTRLVDQGLRYGIPVMAELGAQLVKTYYVPTGFDTVTASCPVPIVMAGGKKLPELDALTMAYQAVREGAAGVDMGRNIFQSEHPVAMLKAVRQVVHDQVKPEAALDYYRAQKAGKNR